MSILSDILRALFPLLLLAMGWMVGWLLAYFTYPAYADLLGLVGFAMIAAILFYHSWMMKVPPIPLPHAVQRAIIAAIPDGIGEIYELGCGFGHLAMALARAFPGRRIVAIEYSIIPFCVAWLWVKICGYRNITVRRGDFLSMDLRDAAVMTSYLYPPLMPHVRDWLQNNCIRPQLLLNVNFPIPDMPPKQIIQVDRIGSPIPDEVFIYEFKPR